MLPSLLHFHPALVRARRAARHPARTQASVLRGLLEKARHTEFGTRHRFADILSSPDVVRAFQDAVPLQSATTLRDELRRVRTGERDVLWPGRMRHFAVSSGTTSDGVALPRTPEHLRRDARFSVEVGLHHLAATGDGALLRGKHLTLPGAAEPDPFQNDAVAGEVSGLVAQAAPAFFRRFYQAVPDDTLRSLGWDARLDAVAAHAADADVRLIAMVPSWSAGLFERVRDVYARRHGHRPTTMGEVWPNLRVFVSGGVALASYRALLREQIGLKGLAFVETYGASEGFFSFTDTPGDPSMKLHLTNGVFYEFVPEAHLHDADPPRLTLDKIEAGPRYALHVSTMSGLWAYAVGDFVRFTHTDPPRLVVAGRTGEILDRYGEAVHGDEAAAAFTHACALTNAVGAHFHVTSIPGRGAPRLRWVVSFDRLPDDAARFSEVLDVHLRDVNRHYAIRRASDAFGPPEVAVVDPQAFLAWLRSAHGHVGAQTKVLRMSEEPGVSDRIIAHSPDVQIFTISL